MFCQLNGQLERILRVLREINWQKDLTELKLGIVGKLLDQLLVRHLVHREMTSGLRGLQDTLNRT